MSKYLQIFLSILILIVSLQSWTKANDINEFEIEGISVGDSVLKHKDLDYVKKILKDSNTFYYKDNAFAVIGLNISSDIFDQISATIKPNDNKFKIYAIEGRLFFPNDIENCKIKMREISNDISTMFPGENFRTINAKHSYDKTGKSLFSAMLLDLKKGNIEIFCIDWSNELTASKGFGDELKLMINSLEFRKWINTKAYN